MSQSSFEQAPSDVRVEAPTVARIAGMAGLFCLTVGAVTVIASQYGRGFFGEGVGYLMAAAGVVGLFLHAARDNDQEVRRLYGGFAALLLVGGLVVSLYPGKPPGTTEGRVGFFIVPWGVGCGLLSLLFFVPFARHETEEPYRTATQYTLLGAGALLCVGAVVGGLIKPDFLVGPGLLLAILGVGFLAAYLSQTDAAEGRGFVVAVALGVLGAVALCIAFGKAVVPVVLHEGPAAIKTEGQAYDAWKVAGRALAVLFGLGIAGLVGVRTAPLWLRAAGAVLGLAVVGVFVAGSFWAPITQQPPPYLVPYGLILAGIGVLYLAVAVGVCSDASFVVLTRRELAAFFYSPIAYIVLFGMAFFAGLGYSIFLGDLGVGLPTAIPVAEPIVQRYMSLGILGAFQAIFVVPALTMRQFSEEKRTGTLEVLLTAPVNEPAIVLSKFVATWVFFMLCWVPAGVFLVALRVAGGEPFDYRPLLSYYAALGACGAAFVGMGLFFSSLTRNQIVAAVLTFAGMTFLLLTVLANRFEQLGRGVQAALLKLDFLALWQSALAGQLPLHNVLIQLSLAAVWLFLTIKVLEARKWS